MWELKPSDTFSVVKSKIHEKEGIEQCLQRLVMLGGEVLQDSETVSERNMENVYLILRSQEFVDTGVCENCEV